MNDENDPINHATYGFYEVVAMANAAHALLETWENLGLKENETLVQVSYMLTLIATRADTIVSEVGDLSYEQRQRRRRVSQ